MSSSRHLRWPAERFYWALLDTSLLPRRPLAGRGTRKRLDYLFEAQLPVPIDQVHAVYRRLGDGRCLAAGVDRARLEADGAEALTLAPEALPGCIDPGSGVRPETLNFLSGAFEPRPLRALRRRRWMGLAVLAVAGAAALVLGMERRAQQARHESAQLRGQTLAALRESLGPEAAGAESNLARAQLRLRGRLEELRRTRPADLPGGGPDRADLTLAALLAAWPRDLEVRVETATVTGSVVAIAGEVATTADAQRLQRALESVEGWRPQQPEIETLREGAVRVGLRLVRSAEAKAP